jgi:hypothetical protein
VDFVPGKANFQINTVCIERKFRNVYLQPYARPESAAPQSLQMLGGCL